MNKKEKVEKETAFFYQRLVAFFIDMIIISIVVSFITFPFTTNNENLEKLNHEIDTVVENYLERKIDTETYITQAISVNHDIAKENALQTLVTLALSIAYFIVYQFYNGGRTIGKRVMRIHIESSEDEEVTMNQYIIRSLLINSILESMLVVALALLASKNIYFYGAGIIEMLQLAILIICALMVAFRKDRRGLHDLISHTVVVRDEIIVEEVSECES